MLRRHLLLIIMGNNILCCCTDKSAELKSRTDGPKSRTQARNKRLSLIKRPSFSSSGLYKDLKSYETSQSGILNATQEEEISEPI